MCSDIVSFLSVIPSGLSPEESDFSFVPVNQVKQGQTAESKPAERRSAFVCPIVRHAPKGLRLSCCKLKPQYLWFRSGGSVFCWPPQIRCSRQVDRSGRRKTSRRRT